MTIAGALRARWYRGEARICSNEYAGSLGRKERLAWQLARLNREWSRACREVPYYSRLRVESNLPEQFSSIEEFSTTVPAVTRGDLKRHLREMTSTGRPSEFTRMTGGSTAEPIHLPAWNSELSFTRPDMWLGRSWYGVNPGSRLFLLWGHSHLLGTGLRGKMKAFKVRAADRMLGYRRISAYDLRPEKLARAARELLEFRPDYAIGYSVALDLFARVNAPLRGELRHLGLKVVIGTAESFPLQDSVPILEDLFGCPVGMEYGSVETNLVAHTRPSGGYRVFWRTYFVEAVPFQSGRRVLVTSLYPRCFPLVRYDLGDEIEWNQDEEASRGFEEFSRVIGRCNQYVRLVDGAVIHSEVFTHAVRPCAEVQAYQVRQTGTEIRLHYLSELDLSEQRLNEVRFRLSRAHPGLAAVIIERVDTLERTVAGKTPMVVSKPAT